MKGKTSTYLNVPACLLEEASKIIDKKELFKRRSTSDTSSPKLSRQSTFSK